jgi:hypothetical protein
MSRPLSLEFEGTLNHVTSREMARESIDLLDDDREIWQEILGGAAIGAAGYATPGAR